MTPIDKYIQKSKTERQAHLKLDEPCIERGGDSGNCRGLLAHVLNTTIPKGKKIACCHACHNAKCNNPNHLYWGTYSENRFDAVANGAPGIHEHLIKKYGVDGAHKAHQNIGSKGGKSRRRIHNERAKTGQWKIKQSGTVTAC